MSFLIVLLDFFKVCLNEKGYVLFSFLGTLLKLLCSFFLNLTSFLLANGSWTLSLNSLWSSKPYEKVHSSFFLKVVTSLYLFFWRILSNFSKSSIIRTSLELHKSSERLCSFYIPSSQSFFICYLYPLYSIS